MFVIETVKEAMERFQQVWRPLGLVPTMGALHKGHMSLVERARKENSTVVASVFVNPLQFGPTEDIERYPRPLEKDMAVLEGAGVDFAFVPPMSEMYPQGFDTAVDAGRIGQRLEGAFRPGHFRGVATVVAKLFNIVRPDRAYFGQKDGQQAAVVKRMAADLNLGVEIVVLPTVREADGLALSSRNVYLTPKERQAATVLYRALSRAGELYQRGERDADVLRRAVREALAQEPLAKVDYVSVADTEALQELRRVDRPAMLSLAVRFPSARLIDNILLE